MKSLIRALWPTVPGRWPASSRPPAPRQGDRERARDKLARETRLHLGCGDNLLSGWANVDLSGPPPVIAWDLTHPLPTRDESFDLVYSEHFIVHITLDDARRLVGECYRVLRKGGVFRVSTPSLEKLVEEYSRGRLDEWHNVKCMPQTPRQLLNEGMRLWGHQFVYDRDELTRLLESAGFKNIVAVAWRKRACRVARSGVPPVSRRDHS